MRVPYEEDLIYLRFCLVEGEKRREKKEVAAIAVEQRTLVRHRLTFHRNPLASSAGGRVSWPRLRCLMGSVAIRQQRDGNIAFSRAKQQAHSPFSAGAARLRDRSTSRRHRHADPCASASARLPSTARKLVTRSALARRILPRVAHRRRNVAAVEYAAARNTNGNYSGANRIFDASRDWSARSAVRVPIISSSVLAFSHGPSFSIRPLPSRFLYSSHGHPFFSSAYFTHRAKSFPFHLDPILYATIRLQTCTQKPKYTLARTAALYILMVTGGTRLQW